MSAGRLELPRSARSTATSRLRVCLFRHADLEPVRGIEPPTVALRERCSANLSYTGMCILLRYQDSNLDCRDQNPTGCQLPHTPSSPEVFAPPGVTVLFLPREGPDTDSQDGRVSRVRAVRFERTDDPF